MNKNELASKLNSLKSPKILVVGDFGIDEMIYGQTERISREAPVLILQHDKTKIILGTASNAANNLATLGKNKVYALGVIGCDYHGEILLKTLKENKIDTSFMINDKTRKTTCKTRISGSISTSITQQIVRIDRQSSNEISKETQDKVIENLKRAIPLVDGIILSDYHLGTLTKEVCASAIKIAKEHNKIVVVDAQKDLDKYVGANAITPNQPDSEKYLGYFINENNVEESAYALSNKLDIENVLITRGSDGMSLLENHGSSTKYSQIKAFNKKEVFDVTGAGDTVAAAFTLSLCSNFTPYEAMFIGNLAASIAVRYFGCHSVSYEELKAEIEKV